jgi:hypothetical protein
VAIFVFSRSLKSASGIISGVYQIITRYSNN